MVALAAYSTPTVEYFPIRGRAEPIKLALAAAGVDFEVAVTDFGALKTDFVKYPFGQVPRYHDAEVDCCQSNAILRHIARKHDLYGSGLPAAAAVDMILDGAEAMKAKYTTLVYTDEIGEGPKHAYWAAHVEPASMTAQNRGAHLIYLEGLVERFGQSGHAVGGSLTIADVVIFEIVDLHVRIYGEGFLAVVPACAAVHDTFAAVPSVKAYLDSPRRLEKVNNNGLG